MAATKVTVTDLTSKLRTLKCKRLRLLLRFLLGPSFKVPPSKEAMVGIIADSLMADSDRFQTLADMPGAKTACTTKDPIALLMCLLKFASEKEARDLEIQYKVTCPANGTRSRAREYGKGHDDCRAGFKLNPLTGCCDPLDLSFELTAGTPECFDCQDVPPDQREAVKEYTTTSQLALVQELADSNITSTSIGFIKGVQKRMYLEGYSFYTDLMSLLGVSEESCNELEEDDRSLLEMSLAEEAGAKTLWSKAKEVGSKVTKFLVDAGNLTAMGLRVVFRFMRSVIGPVTALFGTALSMASTFAHYLAFHSSQIRLLLFILKRTRRSLGRWFGEYIANECLDENACYGIKTRLRQFLPEARVLQSDPVSLPVPPPLDKGAIENTREFFFEAGLSPNKLWLTFLQSGTYERGLDIVKRNAGSIAQGISTGLSVGGLALFGIPAPAALALGAKVGSVLGAITTIVTEVTVDIASAAVKMEAQAQMWQEDVTVIFSNLVELFDFPGLLQEMALQVFPPVDAATKRR